jgi:hypothetical protein
VTEAGIRRWPCGAAMLGAIDRRLANLSRSVMSKTPVIGTVITAAGVGYDIHQGKPPGRAVFSGLAGVGGAATVGTAATGPVGWTALAAVGAGMLADDARGMNGFRREPRTRSMRVLRTLEERSVTRGTRCSR